MKLDLPLQVLSRCINWVLALYGIVGREGVRGSFDRLSNTIPPQIGFWVYQLAKLRVLQFYYDFLDHFVERTDFCMIEMDTGMYMVA